MKNIRKLVSFLLAFCLLFAMTACNKAAGYSDPTGSAESVGSKDKTNSSVPESTSPSELTDSSEQSNSSSSSSLSSATTSSKTSTGDKKTNLTWKQVLAQMPTNLKGTTLNIYSWNEAKIVTGALDVIKKFEQETGIKVKWTVGSYNEYKTEIDALQKSGKAPDIIRLKNIDISIISLLQPLSETKYNFNDEAWDSRVMNAYTVKNKCYGANLKNTLLQQPTVMYYNRNLISKYDLEDPYTLWKKGKWTWNKMIEMCEIYHEEADDGCVPWGTATLLDYCTMKGQSLVKYDGYKFSNNVNNSTLISAIQQTCKWIEDGITSSKWYDIDTFDAGRMLFHSNSIIGARATHNYFPSLKRDNALGVVPMPRIDGQNTFYQNYHELEGYGIPRGASNAKAVPYFLRYYLDSANYKEDTFFTDATVLAAYKSAMSEKTAFVVNDDYVITEDAGLTMVNILNKLKVAKSNQVNTILAENKNQIELGVKQVNNRISRMS